MTIPNNVQVPALSEVELVAPTSLKQTDRLPNNCVLLIKATDGCSSSVVANAIVTPRAEFSKELMVPIWLLNPSSQAVTVYKGTKVAHVSPLRESELVSNVSQTQGSVPHDILQAHQEYLWQLVENSAEVLSSKQQQQLYQVLLGIVDVFAFDDTDLGRTDKLHHTITAETQHPVRQGARRMPVYQKEEVCKLIQDMLKCDVIQPSPGHPQLLL